MKKSFRKILLLAAVVIFAIVCFAFSASAIDPEGELGDNITWTYDSATKELIISGSGEMWDCEPYESPFIYAGISKVVIEGDITSIGNYVFQNCYSLVDVTMPDSIKTIGKYAFSSCYSLEEIALPSAVITIGYGAFDCCDSLKSITIPDGVTVIDEHTFTCCYSLAKVILPKGLEKINDYAFQDCSMLKDIIIPDGVTYIGYSAFGYCTSLSEITIPDGVKEINDYLFCRCTNLNSITIPETVTSIGDRSFYECKNLKSITIPETVTSIGDSSFYGCSSLEMDFNISDKVTYIGESAFSGAGIKSFIVDENNTRYSTDRYGVLFDKNKTKILVYPAKSSKSFYKFPDTVTSIDEGAFIGVNNITEISLSDNINYIPEQAFKDCPNLTKVTLPSNLNIILGSAFSNCDSLKSITIPETVTRIDNSAFYGCDNLSDINILAKDAKIRSSAFNYTGYYNDESNWKDDVLYIGEYLICAKSSITGKIIVKNGTEIISPDAFDYCYNLTGIVIPDGVRIIYDAFAGCSKLADITLPDSITEICSDGYSGTSIFCQTAYYKNADNWTNGVLYIGKILLAADEKIISGSYSVKEGTVFIADEAFYDCNNLTGVTIPSSVKIIGKEAFEYCESLSSLSIGTGVEKIGKYAFRNCDSLARVTVSGNGKTLIDEHAFSGCDKLSSVTIGDGVISIGECGFYSCSSLSSLSLGNKLEYIGDSAFAYCNSLSSVFIPASVKSLSRNAFNNSVLSFRVSSDNKNYSSDSYGVLFDKNKTVLIRYPDKKTDYSYTVPSSVVCIGDGAFIYAKSLYNIYLNSGLQTIGENAFSSSGITSLDLPDSVTEIKRWAFGACENLTTATFGKNLTSIGEDAFMNTGVKNITFSSSLTFIGSDAFYSCNGTVVVRVPDEASWLKINFESARSNPLHYNGDLYIGSRAVTDFIVPAGTTEIKDHAFYGYNSLRSIVIPTSVKKIGNSAFEKYNAYSYFYDLYYYGSEEQWEEIDILPGNTRIYSVRKTFNYCLHSSKQNKPQQNPTCTAVGYTAGVYCSDCNNWLEGHSEIAATNHKKKYIKEETLPTCTVVGYESGVYCPDCRTWLMGHEVIPATNHANRQSKPQQNPTCTEVGYSEGLYCPDCSSWIEGHTEIPAINHLNQYFVKKTNPTCIDVGYASGIYCPDCQTWLMGHEEIPSKGHSFSAATCDKAKTCSVCGETEGDILGHDFSVFVETVLNTCTNGGYDVYKCSRCDETTHKNLTDAAHTLIQVEAKNNTCTSVGWNAYEYCSKCDYTTKVEIPSKGHSFSDATCDKAKTCSVCGETEGDILGHNFTVFVETLLNTCTNGGYDVYKCSRCDETTHKNLTDAAHTLIQVEAKNNTCTSVGWNAYEYCSKCDYTTKVEIPSKGHSFSDATCDKAKICSACGVTEGDVLGHDFSVFVETILNTCTNGGYDVYKCSRCDETTHKNLTDAAHTLIQVEAKNNTCTSVGWNAYEYCSKCDYTTKVEIPSSGHSFTEKITDAEHLVSAATTVSPAIYRYDCAKCDAISDDLTYTYGDKLVVNIGKTEKITAIQNTSTIKITWTEVEGAAGYKVYQMIDGAWKSLGTTTNNFGIIGNLSQGTIYSFAVKAAAIVDGQVIWSNTYTTIRTATMAAAPVNVSATLSTSSIGLGWSADKDVTGFRIFYKTGDTWKICVNATSAKNHTFNNLKPGSKYTFAIKPYILIDGVVIWGDHTEFTTSTKPDTVTAKTASPSKGKITLTWNAVNGADGYQVYYKTEGGQYKLYKTYKAVQSLTFTNLKSGTKYTFAVRAGISTSTGAIFGAYKEVPVTVK